MQWKKVNEFYNKFVNNRQNDQHPNTAKTNCFHEFVEHNNNDAVANRKKNEFWVYPVAQPQMRRKKDRTISSCHWQKVNSHIHIQCIVQYIIYSCLFNTNNKALSFRWSSDMEMMMMIIHFTSVRFWPCFILFEKNENKIVIMVFALIF